MRRDADRSCRQRAAVVEQPAVSRFYGADHVMHEHGEALLGVIALPAAAAIKLRIVCQPALGESEPFARNLIEARRAWQGRHAWSVASAEPAADRADRWGPAGAQ